MSQPNFDESVLICKFLEFASPIQIIPKLREFSQTKSGTNLDSKLEAQADTARLSLKIVKHDRIKDWPFDKTVLDTSMISGLLIIQRKPS